MLPRSVQDQIDAANTLQSQLNQPAEGAARNPAPEAAPAPQPQSPAVEPAAQPAQDPAQAAQQTETRDAAYWRHRFDVLQGKYNAEVPALRKQVSELEQQLAAAQQQQPASAVQRAQTAVADLTEAEIQEFGPDLVNLIKRVAGSVAGKGDSSDELQEIKSELNQMRDDRQQDAVARFWTVLEEQVPNYREINADPAFLAWLAEIDLLSGEQRQQLLARAQQTLDPYRVAVIFRSFGTAAPKKQPIPDELVQPRQTRAAAPEPAAQRVWTRAEISQFYREKASMPAEQAAAIEADIFAAQTQGRIR